MPLPRSPEAKIVDGFVALLRADALFASSFSPIIKVENPSLEAFMAYADGSAAVQPYNVKGVDRPSQRQTTLLGVLVSLYVATEETTEDSLLLGLDWGNYIRTLTWGLSVIDVISLLPITFAVTSFVQLTPLIPRKGSRILSYRALFEADINPTTGVFV